MIYLYLVSAFTWYIRPIRYATTGGAWGENDEKQKS